MLEEIRRAAATGSQGFEPAQQQMQGLEENFKRFQQKQEHQLQEIRLTAAGKDGPGQTQQQTKKMMQDTFENLREQQQHGQEHQRQLEEIRQAVSNNQRFGPDQRQQLDSIQDTILCVQEQQQLQQLQLMQEIAIAGGVTPELFKETITDMKDLMGDRLAEAMHMVEGYGQRLTASQEQAGQERLRLARMCSDEQNEHAKRAHDEREYIANMLRRKGAKEKDEERKQENMHKLNIASSACKKEVEAFARGATCLVYKAEWERRHVAVKVVLLQGLPRDQRLKMTKNFEREVDILMRLRHPNILIVFGIIDDDLTSLQLVTELATRDLCNFLKQSSDVLPLSEQLNMCLQIASGMRYLHSRNVAHRDLKSENVLVCDNDECKISDFGLSKESTGTTVSTGSNQVIGTFNWSAPELFTKKNSKIDILKADRWSYGVLVWEVATRKIPWCGMDMLDLTYTVGIEKQKLKLSESHNKTMIAILNGCCEVEPDKRMTFDAIHECLSTALKVIETARQAAHSVELPPFVRKESFLCQDLRELLESLGIDDPEDLKKLSLAGYKKKADLHDLEDSDFGEDFLRSMSHLSRKRLRKFVVLSPQVCQHTHTHARTHTHTYIHIHKYYMLTE